MTHEHETPAPASPVRAKPAKESRAVEFGCLLMGLGFVVVGGFLLWMYFGGAATKRGNPLMGLIGGAGFVIFGVLALAAALTMLRRKGS